MMKNYIYKGAENFNYNDVCIAQNGDILTIDNESIQNLSRTSKFTKTPSDVIQTILKHCEEYEPDLDDWVNFTDFAESVNMNEFIKLNIDTIAELTDLGILKTSEDNCRNYNVGKSDYSTHIIQPWAIWQDYNLNPWDADIIKRILRTKQEPGLSEIDSRILDYKKIIHICKERIRQLKK